MANSSQEHDSHCVVSPQEQLSKQMEQKSSVLKALISLQLCSQVAGPGHHSALQKDIESDLIKYLLWKNKCLSLLFNSLAVAAKHSRENNQWIRFPNGKQNHWKGLRPLSPSEEFLSLFHDPRLRDTVSCCLHALKYLSYLNKIQLCSCSSRFRLPFPLL